MSLMLIDLGFAYIIISGLSKEGRIRDLLSGDVFLSLDI